MARMLGWGGELSDVLGDAFCAVGIAELGGGLADALLVFRLHQVGDGGLECGAGDLAGF